MSVTNNGTVLHGSENMKTGILDLDTAVCLSTDCGRRVMEVVHRSAFIHGTRKSFPSARN